MSSPTRIVLGLLAVFVAAQAAHGQSQGPNSPNPANITNDTSFGTLPWTFPQNAAASDDMYAALTPLGNPSQYLKAQNFGFSIPGAAVIDGIVVHVERRSAANSVVDARVRIVKGGVIGATDKSAGGFWPTVDTVINYGSSTDLWGETWTAADINSAAFGFAISADDNVDTAAIDFISITVTYSLCGDNTIGLSEDCDDGNTANGDCCSSTCQFETVGSPCPDADLCNGNETCNGSGTCVPGSPLDCDDSDVCTQDSCDPIDGCVNLTTPQMGCKTALKGVLLYKDNTNNAKDKLVWKWVKGEMTTIADFATPTGTTSYTLCIYAGTAQALGGATIPPSNSKWKPFSKGFKYKDPTFMPQGIQKVLLKSGAANKSKVLVKGKGANLPDLPAMPFDSPVTVQLVSSENICFESVFTAPFKKNADGKFKAKAP